MKNIKSKSLIQVSLFFAIILTVFSSYAFSDYLLFSPIFTPVAGLYTAFLVVYGKKSLLPVMSAYFAAFLFGRVVILDELLVVSISITILFTIITLIEMIIFKYLLEKRFKRKQIDGDIGLKDLPYYLIITVIVALVGATFKSLTVELFYSGSEYFTHLYKTFTGLLFGMWVFNGAVIFGYYSDVKLQKKKSMSITSVLYMLIFFAFTSFIFTSPDSRFMLTSFGFVFIFLYLIVGLFSSYHMLVYNNLVFIFLYSAYYATPIGHLSFKNLFLDVNLFLVIANLSPIIIKLILNAYDKKSQMVEKSLDVMKKIVTTSNKYFSNMEYVSFEPDVFFRRFLHEMYELGSTILPKVEMGSCYIIHEDNLEFIKATGYDIKLLNDLKFKSSTIHKTLFEPAITINCDDDSAVDNKERYPEYIEKYGKIIQSIRVNLVFKRNIIGGMSFDIAEGSDDKFNSEDLETYESFYKLLKGNLGMGLLLYKNNKMINDIIISFVRTVGVYDEYTRIHSEEVANLSRNIADILNLDSETADITYYAGVIHDIGKISISPNILNKEGKLTDEEYNIVKGHSAQGYDILIQIEGLKDIAKYIRHHHERWDGFGYPDNLKGDEIPFISQIIGVCDAVSAMMHKRVYSEAKTLDEIIDELIAQRGKQFSPVACDAMLSYLNQKQFA